MAKRRRVPGVRERVRTSKATYTQQRTKRGRTVYRKNGRFASKRTYVAAKASKKAAIERTELGRATTDRKTGALLDEPSSLTPRTAWITGDDRAGRFALDLFPDLDVGDKLTPEQLKEIKADARYVRGFEAFWLERDDLSRDEAERLYVEMIEKLRKLSSAAEREKARIEYGLPGGSGFDARRTRDMTDAARGPKSKPKPKPKPKPKRKRKRK